MTGSKQGDWTRRLAVMLGTFVTLEVVGACVGAVLLDWTWQIAFESFVVTNSAMALAFAICGAVVAFHRPRNPIGWLFVADGLGHGTTALMAPVAGALHDAGAPLALQRLAITLFEWSWPWSIALFLPLALMLFPDGRPVSRRWRPLVWALILTSPVFPIYMGAEPVALFERAPPGYLKLARYSELGWLPVVAELRNGAFMLLAALSLFLRYRNSQERERRQLLWVLMGTIAAIVFTLPWVLVAGTPIPILFAIPLIPASVTVGILRHHLLDIRLVVSRTLAFVLLSAATVACYLGLVALLDRFVAPRFGGSAVATALLVVLVSPLLPRVQRMVDRAMYGDRRDPAKVASRVGEELLGGSVGELGGVAVAVANALRLPFVSVTAAGKTLASAGTRPDKVHLLPLVYGGAKVGELVVGLRTGEQELSSADRNALTLVTAPLAVAVHATRLTEELQSSREKIVAAQEEERRRLRRDLHDGLGPTLTGMALAADAAANLVQGDLGKARELLDGLRRDSRLAITDVRRLVDDLRPPALDELGLVGALRQRAEQTIRRADGEVVHVTIDAPDLLPPLPAAIEVAAFRIATEALNNVVRHSKASRATVRLTHGDDLRIEISDDGPPINGVWRDGVGLQGMRERAAELGGRCEAGPTPDGARVFVSLPLAVQ
ncbi:MAG: histidine kinase [Actinomycetota bacterium]|nr:histidine kinase [Actinomycetota bacterium]